MLKIPKEDESCKKKNLLIDGRGFFFFFSVANWIRQELNFSDAASRLRDSQCFGAQIFRESSGRSCVSTFGNHGGPGEVAEITWLLGCFCGRK